MTNTDRVPNLSEATGYYLSDLKPDVRATSQLEVTKFARWFGRERSLGGLTPAEVESYAEQLSLSDTDYAKKLEVVKAFLVYAKKKDWTKTNLSVHLKVKVRKGKTKQPSAKKEAPETISLTKQGRVELQAELVALLEERHTVIAEMRKAAADKDFRENAPLQAARERRGHIEGRIKELEGVLKAAVVIEGKPDSGQRVGIGNRVVVCEVDSDEELCYTLVPPREADVIKGRMSSASPIGRAILGKEQGETVEIEAPVGKLRYRIKRIER